MRDIDPAYSQLVSGKTVAVVGPARTLLGAGHGDRIDSHDLVVRFNDTLDRPSRPGLAADIGSRTDVLYCNQVILKRALASGFDGAGLQYVVCTNNSLSFEVEAADVAAALGRQGASIRWRVVHAESEQLSRWMQGNWART